MFGGNVGWAAVGVFEDKLEVCTNWQGCDFGGEGFGELLDEGIALGWDVYGEVGGWCGAFDPIVGAVDGGFGLGLDVAGWEGVVEGGF